MHKLGMITIGQAPRSDVAPIVERALEGRAELVQAGALDGLSLDYIQQHLSPSPGEYVLTSRLTTGESVVISREKSSRCSRKKSHIWRSKAYVRFCYSVPVCFLDYIPKELF